MTFIRHKYAEKNYSSNPIRAIKEIFDDEKQTKELDKLELMMGNYMASRKEKMEENQYLVDGAQLQCTHCTMQPIEIEVNGCKGQYTAPLGSNQSKLKVTQNIAYKNGENQMFATVTDSQKNTNISPFGNCKNPPDREEEKKLFIIIEESNAQELRELGTCRYLMKLDNKWENIVESIGYLEVENGDKLDKITMEAVLFCKHGGFIYPVTSGQVINEEEVNSVIDVKYKFKYNWEKEGLPSSQFVTPEFLDKVVEVSVKLKMDPDDLMALMAFESWFNPAIKNPGTGSTATGLIQFLESTANTLGTSTSDLSNMTNVEQMDYVYKYLQLYEGKLNNIGDAYLAILTGSTGIGESESFVLYEKGSSEYNANKVLDKENKGYITREDALKLVLERRELFIYE